MTSIDLSIVINVEVSIVSSSQILMLNCFDNFCDVQCFLLKRFYSDLHICIYLLDTLYEGIKCFRFNKNFDCIFFSGRGYCARGYVYNTVTNRRLGILPLLLNVY